MRFAWYAGVSTGLAAGVFLSAFHQRANFYSAMVHLSQNNLCLLILINFLYIIYGTFMFGLQRLFFGPLRASEVESLSEKAWFAITETCLAMTIFREEIGAWFLVMFTGLVTGKVWGWIGDGRIEILEQQPPADPTLFHVRLLSSLLLSVVYDIFFLKYTTHTVIQQARPNMMVMFLFEFALLTTCSCRSMLRYLMTLVEGVVVKRQTKALLEQRRSRIRAERAEILRTRARAGDDADAVARDLPDEDNVDEIDIEVPGWEAKGMWVLGLDLLVDFVKLGIYTAFFLVLLTFYGLPIHIMRDLFMTGRSFIRKLRDLIRYHRAVRDMNKYPDATQNDLDRDSTCIICREEMVPWDPINDPGLIERFRPKKLPCNHILHLGCLKSWLERQQVCPTCRSPVILEQVRRNNNNDNNNNNNNNNQQRDARGMRINLAFPGAAAAVAGQPGNANGPAAPAAAGGQAMPQGNGVRVFNLGPVRLGFAHGNAAANAVAAAAAAGAAPAAPAAAAAAATGAAPQQLPANVPRRSIHSSILELDFQIQNEIQTLQSQRQEVNLIYLLTAELERVRRRQLYHSETYLQILQTLNQQHVRFQHLMQQQQQHLQGYYAHVQQPQNRQPPPSGVSPQPAHSSAPVQSGAPILQPAQSGAPAPRSAQFGAPAPQPAQSNAPAGRGPGTRSAPTPSQHPVAVPQFNPSNPPAQWMNYLPSQNAIPAGSPELPEGVALPPGWTLWPLSRGGADGHGQHPHAGMHPPHPPRAGAPASTGESTSDANAPRFFTPATEMPLAAAADGHQVGESSATAAARAPGATPTTTETTPSAGQVEAPEVVAPNPRPPNWGGSAQLFGGQVATGVENLENMLAHATGQVSTAASVESAPSDTGASSSDAGNSNPARTEDKGKGRAATVEEADEDEL